MIEQYRRDLLPKTLLTIAEYCGEDVMIMIWEAYCCGRLHVPETVSPDHKLSQLLGYENALDFCHKFGGEMLNIPKADEARREYRNSIIRRERSNGVGLLTLARRFNLTDRQIMKICANHKPASANYDLFDANAFAMQD